MKLPVTKEELVDTPENIIPDRDWGITCHLSVVMVTRCNTLRKYTHTHTRVWVF